MVRQTKLHKRNYAGDGVSVRSACDSEKMESFRANCAGEKLRFVNHFSSHSPINHQMSPGYERIVRVCQI